MICMVARLSILWRPIALGLSGVARDRSTLSTGESNCGDFLIQLNRSVCTCDDRMTAIDTTDPAYDAGFVSADTNRRTVVHSAGPRNLITSILVPNCVEHARTDEVIPEST